MSHPRCGCDNGRAGFHEKHEKWEVEERFNMIKKLDCCVTSSVHIICTSFAYHRDLKKAS